MGITKRHIANLHVAKKGENKRCFIIVIVLDKRQRFKCVLKRVTKKDASNHRPSSKKK